MLSLLWLGAGGLMLSSGTESSLFTPSAIEKENIGTKVSLPFYGLTEQTQRSVNASKEIAFPSLKNLVGGSAGLLRPAAAVFYSRAAQYVTFLRNFPVPFGKVDIIFPFHYFW